MKVNAKDMVRWLGARKDEVAVAIEKFVERAQAMALALALALAIALAIAFAMALGMALALARYIFYTIYGLSMIIYHRL